MSDFYLGRVGSLVSKVPFSLKQSWRRCSWGSWRAKSKTSVQSFHSLVKLGSAQPQANHSPLVYGWGAHLAVAVWASVEHGSTCFSKSQESKRASGKGSLSAQEFVYFRFSAFAVATPILVNALFSGMTIRQAPSHVTTPCWACVYWPVPSPRISGDRPGEC